MEHPTLEDRWTPRGGAPLVSGRSLGRYTVLEPLGAGGMGYVFAAYDEVLGRRVALKVLTHREDDPRLISEARALAKLAHPNVVAVYDVGEVDGLLFLAMELVEGETLRAWLRRSSRSLREIVEVFRGAAAGLHASHRAGLVHRDFKPENVLVGRDGRVRVMDFGLAIPDEGARTARTSRLGTHDSRLTEAGMVMGTPAYMSPEQMRGLPSGPQSDQFSFCVALYEALYNTRPFRGTTTNELVCAVLAGPPARPLASSVPIEIHRAIVRGLAAEPGDRHATMCALDEALTPRTRRGGALRWVAGALMVFVAGAGTFAMREPTTPSEPLERGVAPMVGSAVLHTARTTIRAKRSSDCERLSGQDLGRRLWCLDLVRSRTLNASRSAVP